MPDPNLPGFKVPRLPLWWMRNRIDPRPDVSVAIPTIVFDGVAYADPAQVDATRVTYSVSWSALLPTSADVEVELVVVAEPPFARETFEIHRSFSVHRFLRSQTRVLSERWEIPFERVNFVPDLAVKITVTADPANKLLERTESNNSQSVYGILLG